MTWHDPQQPQHPTTPGTYPPQAQWQQPPYQQQAMYAAPIRKPHSKFGIVSFVIGLVTILLLFALLVVAGLMAANAMQANVELNEESPQAIALGLGFIGGLGVALLGLVFGIVGLLMRDTAKVFSILGVVFNGGILLAVIGLMVIGTVMG